MTRTASGRAALTERTAASSTWAESASCGRKVEEKGPPRRSRNGTRAGRLLVAHVHVGEDREGGQRAAGRDRAREVGAVAQRLAGPAGQDAVAVGVAATSRRRVDPPGPAGCEPLPPQLATRERDEREGGGRAHHSSLSPCSGRRGGRPARDPGGRHDAQQRQPAEGQRGLARRGLRPEVGVAGGQVPDERGEHEALEREGEDGGGQRDGQRRPGQHGADGGALGAGGAQQGERRRALAGHEPEPLDQRVEAHERVDDRHHAQQRGQRAEEGAVARGGAADRGGLRAERRQRAA